MNKCIYTLLPGKEGDTVAQWLVPSPRSKKVVGLIPGLPWDHSAWIPLLPWSENMHVRPIEKSINCLSVHLWWLFVSTLPCDELRLVHWVTLPSLSEESRRVQQHRSIEEVSLHLEIVHPILWVRGCQTQPSANVATQYWFKKFVLHRWIYWMCWIVVKDHVTRKVKKSLPYSAEAHLDLS